MKVYPLEIEAVHTDDERIYMSKGHHDPQEFMRHLREVYGSTTVVGTPTHHWVKKTPANNGEYAYWCNFVEPGTRGAFPATYAHEYGADVYKAPAPGGSQ